MKDMRSDQNPFQEFRVSLQDPTFRSLLKKSSIGFIAMAIHILFMFYFFEPTVRFFFPPDQIGFQGLIQIQEKLDAWEKMMRVLDPTLWILGGSFIFSYFDVCIRPILFKTSKN
jgi:hypothetical protein